MDLIQKIYSTSILGLMTLTASLTMQAQTPIKKEVEVVKPYQPVISDAFKINILPKINDSIIIKPNFEYSINSSKVETGYEVSPIGAAKMSQGSLSKLYKTYFKLGLGFPAITYGELFVNTLRSRTGTGGIYFRHYGSADNIKLENNAKVYGGYADNDASVYGRRFLKKSELFGELNFNNKMVHDYGYKPDIDTVLKKDDIKQSFMHLNFKGGIQSTHTDSSKLLYIGTLGYHYTQDKYKHAENEINLSGAFSKRFNDNFLGLNTSLDIYHRSNNLDSMANSLFNLNPYWQMSSDDYKLNLGLNFYFAREDNGNYLKVYPKIDFQFNVVKEVIVPFLGLSGYVHNHAYHATAWENPYIRPDMVVRNTNDKLNIFGGIKGNLGTKSSYVVKAGLYDADNFYFFANDSSDLWNKFKVIYDEGSLFNLNAEVTFQATDALDFRMTADYNSYNLTKELYAWQKPKFEFSLDTRYNLQNKIIASLETYYMGKRYAKPYEVGDPAIEMKGFIDLNLLLEYRYTKILSGFVQIRNLTASKYQYWNQYPSQRFTVMFGMTYAL